MSRGGVPSVDSTQGVVASVGPYAVYAAGGVFNQHELATNVLIKEAVWRLSSGKFQLVLPQSVESIELEQISAARLRNLDLLGVLKADIVMVRFDGLELDSGTVVEFAVAKSLGKPAVILRGDHRHVLPGIELPPSQSLDAPYNLMVKGWPRTVEVHTESLPGYRGLLAEERQALGDGDTFQARITAELNTVRKSVDEMAKKLIDGLEAVIKQESPYPPEYQEIVYKAFRYCPGSSFDELLAEDELGEIVRRLSQNGTF